MTTVIRVIMLACMLWVSVAVAEDPLDKERSALKGLLGQIESAINNRDIDQLTGAMHKDVMVTFLNGEVVRGIPAVRDYFDRMLGSDSAILKQYRTRAKEAQPATIIGHVALADGESKDEFVFADGSVMKFDTLWSTSLVQEDGQWRVRQLHFSANVFDNPILAAVEKSIIFSSIIALIIGLGLGALLTRKFWK
ncbi:MAG: nuclear transport factor 2 family protein [Gammaproteobacteria bacterium]|nr:nuclear transport factor 2 family protein [Gammaproteobacteria bacterium]MBL6999062.1 nuclear transport factor 2 family protein [Gammaproteobacteria bacterium]